MIKTFLPLALLSAAPVLLVAAGPQLIGSPSVTYTSYSYIRLAWQTNVASSGVVLYGTTTAYGQVSPSPSDGYVPNTGFDTQHTWFLSGLAPSTTFHYCIKSTDQSGNASTCDGITNDFTFTTAAMPSQAARMPQAPQATVDVSEPVQTGRTFTVNAADNCSDPATGLQATLNAANLGDTVVIPHGTVCDGVYIFPAKSSGNGWIVVKSDGALPPAGTRITPGYQAQMATIRDSRPVMTRYNAASIQSASCVMGELVQEIEASGLRPGIHTCIVAQQKYSAALPYTSGTTVPASCSEGDLFYNTATAATLPNNSTFQCVNDRGNIHFVPLDQGYLGPYEWAAAIQFADGANHYRLEGLEVTYPPVPSTYVSLGGGISYGSLISLPATSSNIVLDRLYVHGQDFPAEGPNGGIYLDGAYQALVNSYLDNMSYWLLTKGTSPERDSSAILVSDGPGPTRVQNNFISAVGITFYVSEAYTTDRSIPSDFQISGNYFYKDDKYRLGSPTNLTLEGGRTYSNRHLLELKRGRRWNIQGNVFDGNFSFINQGAAIALTSSPADTGTNIYNDVQVSDLNLSSNIFMNCAQGFVFAGTYTYTTTNGSNGITPSPKTISRVNIENNLFYQLNSALVTNPPGVVSQASAIPLGLGYGTEDLRYVHNTSYCNSRMDGPLAGFFSAPIAGAGLVMNDNVACFGPNGVNGGGVSGESIPSGTFTLTQYWQFYPTSVPGWQFQNNVIYGDITPGFQPGSGSAYPPGNWWPSTDTAVGFNNPSAKDLGLAASSPYKGHASDGTDPGINMVRLSAQTGNTMSGLNYVGLPAGAPAISAVGVSSTSSSTATITWTTNTSSDSLVQFGTTTSYGSFSAWFPALSTSHSVTLTGLTQGMTYHFQVRSTDVGGNTAVSNDQMFTTGGATNVSSRVSVAQSGFIRNRATGLWMASLTVKNISGSVIAGPVQVLLTNIPAGVTMSNSNGSSAGSPYITVSAGSLGPGASANASIQFSNPSNGGISFTPVVYSGGL